jgi:hypothetical protein
LAPTEQITTSRQIWIKYETICTIQQITTISGNNFFDQLEKKLALEEPNKSARGTVACHTNRYSMETKKGSTMQQSKTTSGRDFLTN